MKEEALEAEIKAKNLTAERITPAIIDSKIVGETYLNPDGTTLTICILTLQNGIQVTGESACVSPENFDAEIGKKLARDNARNKIWPLEGYLLAQRIYERTQPIEV